MEHQIAFEHRVLGCNGLYNSFSLGPRIAFDTMPFGFENHLIFGSINFRQDHMEKAIEMLSRSRYDDIVGLIDKETFIADPMDAYENKIYWQGRAHENRGDLEQALYRYSTLNHTGGVPWL